MKDAFLPSAQSLRPPLKRRKLLRSRTPSPTDNVTAQNHSSVAATAAPPNKGIGAGIPICTSCHRASPTGNMIQCAVCSSTTCAVCSRKCTHSAASLPPTPYLTWSPSPSSSICGSPRRSRSVLSLVNFPNLNSNMNLPSSVVEVPLMPTQSPIVGQGKRRKLVDDEDQPDVLAMPLGYTNTGHPKDRLLLSAGDAAEDKYRLQDEYGPGCMRLVCRRCCYEDVASNTTTCLDCYGSLTRP